MRDPYAGIALARIREAEERSAAAWRKMMQTPTPTAPRSLSDEDWVAIALRANPFARETFNLTDQCRLTRINPELARQLQAQAKAQEQWT